MLSDGEAWSGEVAKAVARSRRSAASRCTSSASARSAADRCRSCDRRAASARLARDVAARARVAAAHRRGRPGPLLRARSRRRPPHRQHRSSPAAAPAAPAVAWQEAADELYWWFLWLQPATAALGLLFLRQPLELGLLLGGGILTACRRTAALLKPGCELTAACARWSSRLSPSRFRPASRRCTPPARRASWLRPASPRRPR